MLLTGVPGDVESENAYRGQLTSWLEILAANGKAGDIYVLCDNPEVVSLPAPLKGKVKKAERESLLSLTNVLSARTNPLVVIAWGHGGRQGAAPVFHVRGPRLVPGDFASLAAQVGTGQSTWLLMFRGSGAFAAQLAGPRRKILSSDCESDFSNDPVGMAVLLKAARGDTRVSFTELESQLGRGTAAWYAERNLARTEEPTAWIGGEKPRLLASSAEPESTVRSASGPPPEQAGAAPKETGRAQGAASLQAAEPAAKELPASWQQVRKVQPQDYPDADAVILHQELGCVLGSNPAVETELDQLIQILTPEGKEYGDFDVAYSPPSEELEFKVCEVLGPDGKLLSTDPDAIGEEREQAAGEYQFGRRKFFSMPGVVPGAVLHVRYRSQWQKFPLPQVCVELPIAHDIPALDTSINVSVAKDSAFHFAFDDLAAPDPAVKQTAYGVTYSWHFGKLPPDGRDILSPPSPKGRLILSTFRDWTDFAEWYGRITKLTDEATPEIQAKAKELTRDAKSPREQVLALYNFVTGLRYVAVPLGVNSFRPHSAANVLRNQYGDCKDKANLFNTLLRCLNIDAHLVLVPRAGKAFDDVPGLAFNHAISRVQFAGESLWVDTTDDICRFGLLPPGDPGRQVLVIDGQSNRLTKLPEPEPQKHRLQVRGRVTCSASADGWPVALDALAMGYPDYELRSTARQFRGHGASAPLLNAAFRPVAGVFALEHQKNTAASALDQDFSWEGQGTVVGLASPTRGKLLIHSPFWVPRQWEAALHRRVAPLYLNQGYPLMLDEEFELEFSARAGKSTLPDPSENKQAPLRWRIEWARVDNDKVIARLHAEMAKGEFQASDTPVLQQQIRGLLAALACDWEVEP